MTEEYYCPLNGDGPRTLWRYHTPRRSDPIILIPGRIISEDISDAMAEHERAMWGAYSWTRKDGKVYLWVEM